MKTLLKAPPVATIIMNVERGVCRRGPLAQQMFGGEEETIPLTGHEHEDFFEPLTRMPVQVENLPITRAVNEGHVPPTVLLYAPEGQPERYLHIDGAPLRRPDGQVYGALLNIVDVTTAWLQHVGAVDDVTVGCPCDSWCLTMPTTTPPAWISDALREHMSECIVLTATRMTVLG